MYELLSPISYQIQVIRLLEHLKPDVIYERYTLFSWVGVTLARELGIPLVLEINAPLSHEAEQWRGLELTWMHGKVEAEIFKASNLNVVVSKELHRYVVGLIGDRHTTIVLPNAVNAQNFTPKISGLNIRKEYKIPMDGFVIGYVGGFKPWHDLKTLVRAFSVFVQHVPHAYLLLVGDGKQKQIEEISHLVSNLGLEGKVIFTGSVQHSTVPEYISAMDVTVAPFIQMQSFYFSPIKIFEYMSMEKCVIASSTGQLSEVINSGRNGLLYETEDVQSLLGCMNYSYENSAHRNLMGKAARSDILNRYTWDFNARLVSSTIDSMLL